MATETATRRPSEARDRLLRTASGLFYTKGVRAVGVDEILAEAQVTRATFYRHFPGKDDLIVSYLQGADGQIRAATQAVIDAAGTPAEALRGIGEMIVGQIRSTSFRGCAFLNAATEYPDEDTRIHRTVLEHRAWFLATLIEQFGRALRDEESAEATARFFVMLRDGAMAAGCLSDPDAACAVFTRGVEGILTFHDLADPTRAVAPSPSP